MNRENRTLILQVVPEIITRSVAMYVLRLHHFYKRELYDIIITSSFILS